MDRDVNQSNDSRCVFVCKLVYTRIHLSRIHLALVWFGLRLQLLSCVCVCVLYLYLYACYRLVGFNIEFNFLLEPATQALVCRWFGAAALILKPRKRGLKISR